MNSKLILFVFASSIIVQNQAVREQGQNYYVEAFQQEDEPNSLILKLKPLEGSPGFEILKRERLPLKPRQDEDEEDEPATTPFIPKVIPGLTKIFNGILTGNLNEIFHGSTSFAPQSNKLAIDTVYNTVVGLPSPLNMTSKAPLVVNSTASAAVETTTLGDEDEGDATEEPDRRGRYVL